MNLRPVVWLVSLTASLTVTLAIVEWMRFTTLDSYLPLRPGPNTLHNPATLTPHSRAGTVTTMPMDTGQSRTQAWPALAAPLSLQALGRRLTVETMAIPTILTKD